MATFFAGQRLLAADLERLVPAVSYKTGDTSRSSADTGSTFVNDPHLTAAVSASGAYALEQLITYQAGATGQFKHQWTFPSGTMEAPSYAYDPSAADMQAVTASASPGGLTSGFTGTAGNVTIWFRATLIIGVTGGTLAYQWAQTTSNATATILRKGSRIILTRLA